MPVTLAEPGRWIALGKVREVAPEAPERESGAGDE